MAADDYAKPKQRIAKLMEGASCTNDRGTCKRTTQPKEMVGPEEREGSRGTSVTSHGEPRRSTWGREGGRQRRTKFSTGLRRRDAYIPHEDTVSGRRVRTLDKLMKNNLGTVLKSLGRMASLPTTEVKAVNIRRFRTMKVGITF